MANPVTLSQIGAGLLSLFGGGGGVGDLDKLAAGINKSLGTITEEILRHVLSGQSGISEQAAIAENKILSQILSTELSVNGNLNRSTNQIYDWLLYGFNAVNDRAKERDNSILSSIFNTQDILGSVIGAATEKILSRNASTSADIVGILSDISLQVDTSSNRTIGILREVLDGLNRKVEYVVNNEIVLGSDIFDVILGKVSGILEGETAIQRDLISVFDRTINDTFGVGFAAIGQVEGRQADAQDRMAGALEGIEESQRAQAEAASQDINQKTLGPGFEALEKLLGEAGEAWNKGINSELLTAIFGGSADYDPNDDCLVPLFKRETGAGIPWLIVNILMTAMSAGILPFQMATVVANKKLQAFRTCFPDHALSPPEIRELYHMRFLPKGTAAEMMQKNGYSKPDADVLISTWQTLPDITVLYEMVLRGIISSEQWKLTMQQLGYSPADIERYWQLRNFIPPVQDLVTMAVRDVFDPATVALYGQYDDFPPDFLKYAQQQGVSEYWAKQYWGAHWRLPSENMGFDMFHRGIINEEELKRLMKSLDIMPGWRDKLIKLSYNPLTRVDVRRMYDVGVLSEDEVTRAYLDIGYSPENAKRLTDFTKQLSHDEGLLTTDIASDLTRSNIIGFYADGIISRAQALALLLQAGINAIAAELFLRNADFDIERKHRKQLADLVTERYKSGRYTFDQATAAIGEFDFSAIEAERLELDLEILEAKAHKVPPVNDLRKMLSQDIISDVEYLDAMKVHGYSEEWSIRYARLT